MIRHRYLCPSRRLWILATLFILTGGAPAPSGAAPVPTQPNCYEIEQSQPFDKWKDCTYGNLGIGNVDKFVVLDFSAPSGQEINDFFARAPPSTKYTGGIKIVGNKDLTTLNLGQITKWFGHIDMPSNALFIEISSNVNLKDIQWKVATFKPGAVVQILIYNNPKLNLTQAMVDTLLAQANRTSSHIQTDPTECMFSRPTDDNLYISPEQNLLDYCATIKGDLDLKDLVLKKDLTVTEPGCLRLVNVDMTTAKVKIGSFTNGTVLCKNGVSSEIKNNDGLCGDDLTTLMKYFPAGSTVAVELHPSCTKSCDQSLALHQYILCQEITGDVDITPWFEPGAVDKKSKLKVATNAVLTISGGSATKLSLPLLTAAKGLEIVDNTQLKDLELPLLNTVERLKIEGNNKDLTLKKLNQLIVNVTDMDGSKVECYTEDSGVALVINNVSQLGYCTHVIGKLVLDGLQKDVNPADVHLKEIKGCIQIENTGLSNLDFLTKANISGCAGSIRHRMTNNPQLCDPEFDAKGYGQQLFKDGKVVGCGTNCTSLKPSCAVFKGDLMITSSTPTADFANLGIIYGSLVIDGTTHEVLEFPKLSEIHATKAPALRVTNNAQLKVLKMKRMTKIVAKSGKPVVEITGNPYLKLLNNFLPSGMSSTCSGVASSNCYYIATSMAATGGTSFWLSVGGILTIIGLAIVGVALLLVPYALYRIFVVTPAKVKKIQQDREMDTTILLAQQAKAREHKRKTGLFGGYQPKWELPEKNDETTTATGAVVSTEDTAKSTETKQPEGPSTRTAKHPGEAYLRRISANKNVRGRIGALYPRGDPVKPRKAKTKKAADDPVDKTQSVEDSGDDPVNRTAETKTHVDDPLDKIQAGEDPDLLTSAEPHPSSPPLDEIDVINISETFFKKAPFDDLFRDKSTTYDKDAFLQICMGLLSIPPIDTRRILYKEDWNCVFQPGQKSRFDPKDFKLDSNIYLSTDMGGHKPSVPSKTGSFLDIVKAQTAANKRKHPVNIFHVGERKLYKCHNFFPRSCTRKLKKLYDRVFYTQFTNVRIIFEKNGHTFSQKKCINVIDMTEHDLPDEPKFGETACRPWLAYVHEAKRTGVIMHTTSAKYYFMLQMMSATMQLLTTKKAHEKYENLGSFGIGIYKRLLELYNPEAKPMDAFFMWQHNMLFMYHEFLRRGCTRKILTRIKKRPLGRLIDEVQADGEKRHAKEYDKETEMIDEEQKRVQKYLTDISTLMEHIAESMVVQEILEDADALNVCQVCWPTDPKGTQGFMEDYHVPVAEPGKYFPHGQKT